MHNCHLSTGKGGVRRARPCFATEATATPGDAGADTVLMVVDYFKKEGLNCTWKQQDRALYQERLAANPTEATCWGGGYDTPLYLSQAATASGSWMTGRGPAAEAVQLRVGGGNDPAGRPPPEEHWLWMMWETWQRGEQTLTEAEHAQVVKEIMAIWEEQFPVVGFWPRCPVPASSRVGS